MIKVLLKVDSINDIFTVYTKTAVLYRDGEKRTIPSDWVYEVEPILPVAVGTIVRIPGPNVAQSAFYVLVAPNTWQNLVSGSLYDSATIRSFDNKWEVVYDPADGRVRIP